MENGVCLARGEIKGDAYIGVIKALEEENIYFNYIGETSSGSIIAFMHVDLHLMKYIKSSRNIVKDKIC